MNTRHPSEREIQQFAVDKSPCATELITHINNCADCRAEVSAYQLIFSEIKQQSGPSFAFDLPGLVLPQLQASRQRLSPDQIVAGFLVLFICCCIAVPVYFFRQYFLYMFSGISTFFIYAIVCSAVTIVLLKALHLYKKYQKQMRLLNFN